MAKAKKEVGYDSTFPTNLRNILKEKGMTQEQLADKIGVKRQAVGKWCSGDTVPDIVSLERMSQVLNRSTDWLLGRSTFKNKETEYIKASDLGLSEKAIEVLQQVCITESSIRVHPLMPIINYLIEQEEYGPSSFSYSTPENISPDELQAIHDIKEDEFEKAHSEWEDKHSRVITSIAEYISVSIDDNKQYQILNNGTLTEQKSTRSFSDNRLDAVSGISAADIVERTLLDRLETVLKRLKQQKRREDVQHGEHPQD